MYIYNIIIYIYHYLFGWTQRVTVCSKVGQIGCLGIYYFNKHIKSFSTIGYIWQDQR